MALKKFWLGSTGPFYMDRSLNLPSTDGSLTIKQAPITVEKDSGDIYALDSAIEDIQTIPFHIPSEYVEMTTPVGTVSAVLEDVSGASITITPTSSTEAIVMASFEVQTQSGASASTIGIAVNINGVDHDEMQRYLSGSNDLGLGSLTHRSATLTGGVPVTIKLRFRRVTGVATPGINKAHMAVLLCEAVRIIP